MEVGISAPLVDLGNAKRFYVSGLGRVVPMGAVALFQFELTRPGAEGDPERVIEVELIAPVEAVGPAFEMAITALGPRTIAGMAGSAVGRALNAVVRNALMIH